jgi:hypothetical protein
MLDQLGGPGRGTLTFQHSCNTPYYNWEKPDAEAGTVGPDYPAATP